MSLKEQIVSFIFSFLYGTISSYLYITFYRFFHDKNRSFNILNSLLFVVDLIIIYFVIFLFINEGDVKIVFVLITMTTFFVLNYKNLQKKCKNMFN